MIPTRRKIQNSFVILIFLFFPFASLLSREPDTSFTSRYKYIHLRKAILRTNPTTYAYEIAILNPGEKVEVLSRTEKKSKIGNVEEYWYYVKTESGYTGWIFGGFLTDQVFQNPVGETRNVEEMESMVAGVWWEVDEKERTRFRSLELLLEEDAEGKSQKKARKFIYSYQGKKLLEGRFEVFRNGTIHFYPSLPVGEIAELKEHVTEYRLLFRKDGRQWFFKKASVMESSRNDGNRDGN